MQTFKLAVVLLTAAAGFLAPAAHAAPVSVDGTIGAEWGSPTATVALDTGAAQNNFGAPGTTNHNVAYSIYLRSDGTYLYGAVAASGPTNSLDFANIYLNVDGLPGPGSDLGIEVTNDRFFRPGLPGYTSDSSNLLTFSSGTGVIEFALEWSMLTDDPYGMGFNTATPGGNLFMSLSQSFGYSVAGGTSYGDNRLGNVTVPQAVPEPGTLALFGLAMLGVGAVRRSRKSTTAD